MRFPIRVLPLIPLSAALLAGASAAAVASDVGGEGKASGSVTCNGKRTLLQNAYAYRTKNPLDGKQERVIVVLSDQSVIRLTGHPPATVQDEYALSQLADAGKVNVVMLLVSADRSLLGATLYGKALTRPVQASGAGAALELTKMDDRAIAGRAYTEQVFDTGADKVEWSATFEALLPPSSPAPASATRPPKVDVSKPPSTPAETTTGSPKVGVLAVDSDPPGAFIKINGEMKGVTPAEVEIPVGATVDIVLHLAGYRDYHEASYVLGQARAELKPKLEER